MKHFMPVRLCTGEHSVAENAELFQHCGSRCMIVTGKTSAVKSGALDDVAGVLNRCGIPYRVFDEISQNPSVDSCIRAGRAAGDFGADFVVGIGGGSALDAAKAAAVFAANGSLDENGFYAKNWDADPLPILLVGTTSGTGSEVTKVSVLTDSKGRKHSIHDDRLFAAAAFGDARYTMALPQPVTLSTGIDVLSHCAESWFNRKADELSAMISDGTAEFAVAMVDLNDLKRINDQLGHKAGDMYINGCCHIICDVFKHSPVFRIGGDEFVAILMGVDYQNRDTLIQQIKAEFSKCYSDIQKPLYQRYSAAVGLAVCMPEDATFEYVFRRADKAMYADKMVFKKKNGSYR